MSRIRILGCACKSLVGIAVHILDAEFHHRQCGESRCGSDNRRVIGTLDGNADAFLHIGAKAVARHQTYGNILRIAILHVKGLNAARDVNITVLRLIREEKNIILTNDESEIRRYLDVLTAERKNLEVQMQTLPQYFTSGEGKALCEKMIQSVKAWLAVHERVVELGKTSDAAMNEQAQKLSTTQARQAVGILAQDIQKVVDFKLMRADELNHESTRMYETSRLITIIGIIASVLVGLGLGFSMPNVREGKAYAGLSVDGKSIVAYAPVKLGRSGKFWSVLVRLPRDVVLADADALEAQLNERAKNDALNQIMRVLDTNHIVLQANDAFLKLHGFCREEVIGVRCSDYTQNSEKCATCAVTRVLNGAPKAAETTMRRRKNGDEIYCDVVATPFLSPEGELLGAIEDCRDVTELVKSQRAMRTMPYWCTRSLSTLSTVARQRTALSGRRFSKPVGIRYSARQASPSTTHSRASRRVERKGICPAAAPIGIGAND